MMESDDIELESDIDIGDDLEDSISNQSSHNYEEDFNDKKK